MKGISKKKISLKRRRYSNREAPKMKELENENNDDDEDWCFETKKKKKTKINSPVDDE